MTDDRREWSIYRDDERLPWREKYSTANRYDIVNNEVYCSRCCDWYDKDTFPLDKNNKHGLHLYCRNCKRADSDRYKKSRADSARRKRYGIAADEYDNLFSQQNGVCAICRQPETRVVKGVIASLAVDHDHNTGDIRGLLCSRCNIALGHVEAIYAGWFESAEQYLLGKAIVIRGTNFADGVDGSLVAIASPQKQERISKTTLRRKLSPEHRETLRQANLGRKQSPEHIEKRRQATLGRKNSPEHTEKIRQSRLGIKHSPESKEKIRQSIPKTAVQRVEDGVLFASLSDAALSVDRGPANILRAITTRGTCAGYHWERVGETPPADPYTRDGNALMMRID